MTAAEKLTTGFLSLIEYFRVAGHIQEGVIDTMGIGLTEREAVHVGWLRPVQGPGRLDNDWLVPAGALATAVAEARGSHVRNSWANYQERQVAA